MNRSNGSNGLNGSNDSNSSQFPVNIACFEDLEIWKQARYLTNEVYRKSCKEQFARDFGLREQIRRAAVSVMSNIAEGFERGGNQELIQFLAIAKASCGEVRCQVYVAMDQGYIDKEEGERLIDACRKLSVMLNNFMKYLKGSPYKGQKYKGPPKKSVAEEADEVPKWLTSNSSNGSNRSNGSNSSISS